MTSDDPFEEPPGAEAAYSPPRSSAVALAKAGLIVSAAYLVARVLGYVRVVVIGTTFGAGEDLDAFFAAFRIPDLIFQLVAAGAVASAVVPIVSGLVANGEPSRAWRVVSTLINMMLVGLLVFAAIAFIWAPQFVAAITPGFSQPMLDRTVELTRIMLASPILLALGAVATAALNSERRFAASAIAPIVYNLAIIGAAVLLSESMGVFGLALGVVAGSLGLLVVQLPALRRVGFRYAPRIDLADDQARKLLKLMGPRVLGLSASQITMVVMTSLATGVGLGAVTAFTIAFALYQIPMGVIGIPLGIVIFPSMSREVAEGRTGSYLELVARATRILLFVMLPIAALGIALHLPAVDLLLGYGRFDEAAVELTAQTLVPLLLGLTGHAVIGVFARAFYARQDTRTPVLAAVLAVVVNTTLGFALVGQDGLPALGLAIAVAAWIEAGVLLFVLWRREPDLDVGGILWVGARSLLAAIAAGVVAFFALQALVNSSSGPDKVSWLVGSGIAALLGGAVYVAVAFVLRIPELRSMSAILRDVVQRRAGA